jgi:hypothetical protein
LSDVRCSNANYYKTEVKAIIQHNNVMPTLSDSNDDCYEEKSDSGTDKHSSMTEAVLNHHNYIKPTTSKNTKCSTRAAMESIAYRSQKAQAHQLNKERLQDKTYKQVLDVGDIGIVYVQPKTWNSCDHPYLPVMVMGCKIPKNSQALMYKLCCQYGPLHGFFAREIIRFEEHMTPEFVQIDPSSTTFNNKKYTIEEANAKHNVLGGKSFCRCKKDCALVKKCNALLSVSYAEINAMEAGKIRIPFHCSYCVHDNETMEETTQNRNNHGVK